MPQDGACGFDHNVAEIIDYRIIKPLIFSGLKCHCDVCPNATCIATAKCMTIVVTTDEGPTYRYR